MAVPEEEMPGPVTISGFAFHRAPSGDQSAVIGNAVVRIGSSGGSEIGPDFEENMTSSAQVLTSSVLEVEADENGMVVFTFDTPWEYEGGDLLLDLRFGSVSGYLYVYGWTAPGRRYLSSMDLRATRGTASENLPVITLITE